ncbi:acyl-CoA dehydrogenase family protein [Camelimonas sp. ID_303_24]
MNAPVLDELQAFRAAARTWLTTHFVPSLKGKSGWSLHEAPGEPEPDVVAWTRAMGERGWGTPTWPKAYGGGGLTAAEARVLQQEMDRIGAWNPIGGLGKDLFGPTLLEYGSVAQKQEHLPPLARQEVNWCQGFSEPGSGSDLASLQTRAIDMGDHFLVNGQKVWTSGGQWADMCFCLVRTDTSRKHEGISFVLIDMRDPGVEVRPIRLIAGESPFCETFFTDVKVPKANLVGPLNGGWTIAKRLLQYERSGDSSAALGGGVFGINGSPAELAVTRIGRDGEGRIDDLDLRGRIVRHEMDHRAFQLTMQRMMAEARSNQGPSAATSILKNAGTRIGQDRAELMVEILGVQGLGWAGDGFDEAELAKVRGWLAGKATTIFGGSFEVQNNIVSKRILGLPDA